MCLAAVSLTTAGAYEAADGEIREEGKDRGGAEEAAVRGGMREGGAELRAQTPDSAASGQCEEAEEDAHHLQPEHSGEANGGFDGGGLKTVEAFLQAAGLCRSSRKGHGLA